MKIHLETFFSFYPYYPGEYITCWYPGCQSQAVDICHIEPRGMGGRESADFIENLCPMCRKHHTLTEGKLEAKLLLFPITIHNILKVNPNHQYSYYFSITPAYRILTADQLIPTLPIAAM